MISKSVKRLIDFIIRKQTLLCIDQLSVNGFKVPKEHNQNAIAYFISKMRKITSLTIKTTTKTSPQNLLDNGKER